MISSRLLQNIPTQRQLLITEEIMEHVVDQIKSTYSCTDCIRETLATLWIRGNIRALKLNDIDLEFTCDEEGINLFIINQQPMLSEILIKRSEGNMWAHLKGNTHRLKGRYVLHDGCMFTHFRFSPTHDGVLQLLKLVDVCVDRVKQTR